ncbi:MAG: cyclic pyranopterin monophosphate synthase MoaC [Verrucomicrobia bacterium]|nr:cyclic pyranopterin monophosphate synthase MoaC [Verrucomicrobiota bacterium]MDA1065910.1 cyclic pyranopterin monophosphate synthase MoaC [Verrucomicrobiota bacterium]
MSDFTHINESNQPSMVDISGKSANRRTAVAQSIVQLTDNIWAQLHEGEIQSKKGPVFQTAILAGIMAAKKTSDLIPLCHPLPLDNCKIDIEPLENQRVKILCSASTDHKTGVEMEALTGASVAALTLYDMCKALSHDIRIVDTRLISKTGGKHDFSSDSSV